MELRNRFGGLSAFALAGLVAAIPAAWAGQPRVVVDRHAIPAFGGQLVGSNDGEWGGELAFVSAAGQATHLIDKNVVALHEMPFGVVAVVGLAHMSINEGELLLVTQRGAERIRVDRLTALPHAPVETWQRADKSIDIAMLGGWTGGGADAKRIFECVKFSVAKRLTSIPCPDHVRYPE